MKMVKSLLLGAAAGLVALTGAQAADLPVKAKPVQYVKICSLYGAGFYYIPGTDTCLKVGGWVRLQAGYGYNGANDSSGFTAGPMRTATEWDRTSGNDPFTWRVRGYITADARSQTEYGTLRSYIAVGTLTNQAGGATFNSNRAFIQLAGFTFGLAQSFYDFTALAALAYNGGAIVQSGDTGDGGQVVWGYTAQFGNGLSATIAAQAPANRGVYIGNGAFQSSLTAAPASSQAGITYPDVVANLRVDQVWGSAQIMGAVHGVRATYYAAPNAANYPEDELGYAIGAGLRLNAPMIGKGDYISIQANYTVGATGYATHTSNYGVRWDGTPTPGYNSGAYGLISDGVYGMTTGSIDLTEAWGVFGGFEHNWNPKWKTSIYGSYLAVNYNENANLTLCGTAANVTAGCNNDYRNWAVGTRTAWAPVPNLEIGLDVVYQKLETASNGFVTGITTLKDRDAWMTHLRIQRNFYP